ncbi:hypothetical protein FHU33_4554 [Blastococcus colisei]|uniref:Uncharacterized protein n=1 Tax=Blastococcus colisei TaxID=1564162 RepID=A0A543P1B1_9ACTN|nr:hypothetical protein [Blastococcus colisei]TQN37882.1 hypothetical protein FHU33_4554 [Blastococcus colisei]
MLRWSCALVTGAVLSAFALLLVGAEYETESPVVVEVTRTHGLHSGDLLVVGGWVVAVLALLLLTVRSGRTPR